NLAREERIGREMVLHGRRRLWLIPTRCAQGNIESGAGCALGPLLAAVVARLSIVTSGWRERVVLRRVIGVAVRRLEVSGLTVRHRWTAASRSPVLRAVAMNRQRPFTLDGLNARRADRSRDAGFSGLRREALQRSEDLWWNGGVNLPIRHRQGMVEPI